MYHNTTEQTPPEVLRYRRKAKQQDAQIMEFFEANPKTSYTPSEILRFVFEGTCPITSVRRSMSNLTADGELVKTAQQKDGPYGRPEYTWRLAPSGHQGELF